MISYQYSKKILKKAVIKIKDESIKSLNSLNRVSSKNIYCGINYPTGDNAAFDGYAINSNDSKKIKKNFPKKFKITGLVAAGNKPFKKKIKKFDAVEIMTGGIIPKGFDTVIPIEKIIFYPNKSNKKYILINNEIKKHNHVRFAGSDFKKKELVLKKNTIIKPNHILAFKTLGIQNIVVKKKINILFFSTGNEISNNDNIPDWKVRNSNSHYIKNLKENFLFNFKDGGILRDNHEKIFKSKITKMLNSKIDIIVTSGAVSAGKFDFVPNVIKSFNLSNYFKSVAIRPGKPVLFAKIKGKQKAIFGLPGNPMSSAACFRFFVYPYIVNLLGLNDEIPLRAILKNKFVKKMNFTRFAKSRLNTTKNGKIEVEILKGQESFRIKSFIKSNIWALLPAGKSKFKKGEIVDCFLPNHSNQTLS
ncbi:molybdopterin molybdotransferase MoeA [Candidatus Pelagibacter sp.]|jgi:molybdopterin molybdotransferase|nr:molybdopterin molybdotransferase MoeA [Candidatus Pelagibacter sp.]|tara:strand:+ start:602 stop:1855 length:1254 start_codon:yes stop_codon:yes gene_type:complete